MKKNGLFIAAALVLLSCLAACHHHRNNHDLSVSVQESDGEYQFNASFDEDQTKKVQRFMSGYTNGLFRSGNTEIDALTTLDDNTQVYIKCHPGTLRIKFDRDENSEVAYEHAKEMCEGIKEILTGEEAK